MDRGRGDREPIAAFGSQPGFDDIELPALARAGFLFQFKTFPAFS